MEDITQKTNRAYKWSSITEISSKFITPLINMLLARILAPEAFGILATITMVISFAEIFVESGFQKFLIQHEFKSEEHEHRYMSVAFWANLAFSILIWGIIIIFCQPIASIAGNEGLGFPIALTGITIPLFGIIGIQNCKLKKKLEFKGLFLVRIISALVPLFVTLPCALIGLDFWSLIIGNIAGVCIRSIMLIVVGRFKPLKYFSFKDLKHMLKYGVWTLLDGLAIWATNWIDSLIIAHSLDEYYLGLYRNSASTIVALFAIVTSAITPVLFASLARQQNDQEQFNNTFLKLQKTLSVFLIPIAVGVYFYRDLVTLVLFGEAWAEAADIIGIMAITTAMRTVFISFYGDAYRAKGKFYLPLILQLVDLAILVPSCIISIQYGFWALVYTRAFVKLDLIVLEFILIYKVCKITPWKTILAVGPAIIATIVMAGAIFGLQLLGNGVLWSLFTILIAIIIYFSVLFIFKTEREFVLKPFIKKLKGIYKKFFASRNNKVEKM